MWHKVFLISAIALVGGVQSALKLEERYSWTQLDFAFPSEELKQMALASGDYIPTNALPVGVEHWQNRLFVTVPRWRNGIPATLTYINMDQTQSGSPELIPYPDIRSNTVGDCANGLQTVYRIKADKCGRLWVLDTGTIGIGNTTQQICPYSVNVFDLATNTRIRRYEFRPEDTNANTFIANTAVDIGKSCDDTFAYFSDELGYGLVVYSWEKNKSWRFNAHSYFFPDPLRGDFNVAGLNFQWGEEGIFGLALSPLKSDGYRTLFFSPLASHREFSVSTRVLRDETRVEDSYHDFTFMEERSANGHTTSRVMSDDGIMLFNLIDQNAVGCWHSTMPYNPQFHGVVDRDDVGLVFPADVKIDENQDVWVLSDRMPVFLIAELDFSDVNFRIYTAPLATLVDGTVCELRNNIQNRFNSYGGYFPLGYPSIGQPSKPKVIQSNFPTGTPPTQPPSVIGKNPLAPVLPSQTIPPTFVQSTSILRTNPQYQLSQLSGNYKPVKEELNTVEQTTPKNTVAYIYEQPRSIIYQKVPLSQAKAYVVNHHSGVSYETNSPNSYSAVHHGTISRNGEKRNWWSSDEQSW